MARARNIRPSMMANEELAELDGLTRLLFAYLWMLADREGRLEDRPKRIAALALPFDRTADVVSMLDQLANSGFIHRYLAGGVHVIQILAFHKHQNPHATEKDSDLPDENGYLKVHERQKNGCATGKSTLVQRDLNVKTNLDKQPKTLGPLNGNTLIPDSCSLIPDSQHTLSESVNNPDPVCVVLEGKGIQHLNPNDPEFTRLKSEGADVGLWTQAATIAVDSGNCRFDYVLGIVRRKLQQQASSKAQASAPTVTVPGTPGPCKALAEIMEGDKLTKVMPSEFRSSIFQKFKQSKAAHAAT